MNQQRGFFDEQDRLALISSEGDPLEKLDRAINWEMFRGKPRRHFAKEPQEPGGRPRFDCVLMFKVLVLQRLYNLSDAQMQFQLLDRLSFQRFLGLGLHSAVPDQKTIWAFREKLTERGVIEKLFTRFQEYLDEKGIIVNRGSRIDATFVEVPRQRNSRDENEEIHGGQSPLGWSEDKERQKDTDARWTKKGEQTYFGYKDHVKVDKVSKVITSYDAMKGLRIRTVGIERARANIGMINWYITLRATRSSQGRSLLKGQRRSRKTERMERSGQR
jgi:transposase